MPTVKTHHYRAILILLVIAGGVYGGYLIYSNSTGALVASARLCLDQGDLVCAREHTDRILARNPDHLDALFMASLLDFQSKNYHLTETNLKKVLSYQPNKVEARKILVKVYLWQSRFLEAIEELQRIGNLTSFGGEEKGELAMATAGLMVGATNVEEYSGELGTMVTEALAEDPQQTEAHLANAILQLQFGNGQAALDEARIAHQRAGSTFATEWVLGRALYLNGNLEEALAALDRADQRRKASRSAEPPVPWTRQLYLFQGLALIEQGRLAEAQRRLEIALEIDPDSVEATLALVNLYLIQSFVPGQTEEAGEQSDRFHRLAVDEISRSGGFLEESPNLRYQLALIYIYLGNFKQAVDNLDFLSDLDPPYLQALQELGDLLNSQANYSRAAMVYERILAFDPERALAEFNLGTILVRNREVEAARERLRSVVAKRPDWLKARLNLALASRLAGRFSEARTAYQVILDQIPENMDALIGLGLIASARNDFETAGKFLEKAREQHPERSEPYFHLGQIELDQGRILEAQRMFERCLAIDSDNEYAALALVEIQFRKGTWEQARERLQAILNNPNARLRVAAQTAMALVELKTGNQPGARAILQSLEDSIAGVDAYLKAAVRSNEAILSDAQGDSDSAISIAKEVVDLAPEEPNAHYNLGAFQLEGGRFSEAILSLRRAIELNPNHMDARFNMAVAQTQVKRWDEALSILDELAREPNASLEVVQSLGEAYLGAEQPEAALRVVESALEDRTGQVALQTLQVKALIGVRELDKANVLSEQLIKTYPQDAQVQMVRGIVSFLLGDHKSGETHLRRSLQIDQTNVPAKLNLAIMLVAKGEFEGFEEADEILNEIEKSGLFTTQIYNQRAYLSARRSDFESAREWLAKSLEVDSNQPEISALLSEWVEL